MRSLIAWLRLVLALVIAIAPRSNIFAMAMFSDCRFNFGQAYMNSTDYPSQDYNGADYLTIWIGGYNSTSGKNTFNEWWHGAMLAKAQEIGATPVYYAYIIALMAREGPVSQGVQACDISAYFPPLPLTLCQEGANFIRQNRAEILSMYADYARETANRAGTLSESIWLIEPDFYQYSELASSRDLSGTRQFGGGLSGAEMRALLDDIAATILASLPNAKISLDVSPWSDFGAWWSHFADAAYISYIHTSSGRTEAGSCNIRNDCENTVSWSEAVHVTGKLLIADDGYGNGGAPAYHAEDWDNVDNLRRRMANGVVGITQAKPKDSWRATIDALRTELATETAPCHLNTDTITVCHETVWCWYIYAAMTVLPLLLCLLLGCAYWYSRYKRCPFSNALAEMERDAGQTAKQTAMKNIPCEMAAEQV